MQSGMTMYVLGNVSLECNRLVYTLYDYCDRLVRIVSRRVSHYSVDDVGSETAQREGGGRANSRFVAGIEKGLE